MESNNRPGTHAARAPSVNNVPSAAAETAAPPPDSRAASVLRAVARRLDSVPSGNPSCRAASLRLRPSSSHRTTGSRYFSGRRASSPVQQLQQFALIVLGRRDGVRHGFDLSFLCPAPEGRRPGAESGAVGDAVEPASDGLAVGDGGGLLGQDEEGRLEGVLGVLGVAEDAAADGQHHRPVPAHQGREGGVVAAGDELAEQLPVREAAAVGQRRLAEPPEHHPHATRLHARLPARGTTSIYRDGRGGASIYFSA